VQADLLRRVSAIAAGIGHRDVHFLDGEGFGLLICQKRAMPSDAEKAGPNSL
jgi:hypothetical protein